MAPAPPHAAPADSAWRKYRAQRLHLPQIPAPARSDRTTGLAVKFHYPQTWIWNTGTSRDFSYFSGVRKSPSSQIQVSEHVTNRANLATGKPWPILAAVLFWLSVGSAAHSQPATSSTPAPTGEWLVADRVARIKIVDCSGHPFRSEHATHPGLRIGLSVRRRKLDPRRDKRHRRPGSRANSIEAGAGRPQDGDAAAFAGR
jgi:hypothetical protein